MTNQPRLLTPGEVARCRNGGPTFARHVVHHRDPWRAGTINRMAAPPPTPAAPPVDLLDCPHSGDLYLMPRRKLTIDDCEKLAAVLADRAREKRHAMTETRQPEA